MATVAVARAILFTDVEGSTELLSRVGDGVAGEMLRAHEEIVRDGIRQCGGREIAFRGDGFLAVFDSACAAGKCAVAIQRALESRNVANPQAQVRVRMGVHVGEVMERDGQLYGQAVHVAARVMSEAMGGEIFVSPAVADACRAESPGEGVALLDRGLYWLKGLPQRWRLFELYWRDAWEASEPAPTAVRALTAFVGRDAERADLRRAVREALGGRGRLCLVGGEAGVGKSRFVAEIAAEAELRGMRVLTGHSAELERGAPYLPFVELLEQALIAPQSPMALREALGDQAGEIARLLPALRRVVPDLPPPLELPPDQARRYLWSSIDDFLRRAAHDRPLLLILEDLHWADESSLHLLAHLAPLLESMPVLIVGTYRDVEVGAGDPLARMLNDLTRRRLVQRTSLKPLAEPEVAAMIQGLAGHVPPAALVRTIHSETDGNPFFVEEVFLHLAETGKLLDERGRFRANLRVSESDVPETIRLVIGERLARLSDESRQVLEVAAIAGRLFEPAVVAAATRLDAESLAAAFDEAERARLIEPVRRDGRSSFVHELIRQTLIADASSVRRRQLHGWVADAIEQVHAASLDDHAADLAFHLSHAGPAAQPHRLVRYLKLAGEQAVRAAAFEDAVAHYEHALSLVPAGDDSVRAELLERLAIARRSQGQWDSAVATMNEALELYQRLGQHEAFGRLCWSMVYQLSWAARFEEAVTLAARGLAVLGELPNPDRARLQSATGWVLSLAGDYGQASDLFRSGRELAGRLGDQRALADVLHMETAHHMGYMQFRQGIEAGLAAARVFAREGALWDLCSVLAFVEFQHGTILQLTDAAALTGRVAGLARRLGHLGAQFLVLSDRIRREGLIAGDLALTEAIAREQVEVCQRGDLPWLYVGHMYLGFVAHWSGRWDDAEREFRRAVELEPPGAFQGQATTHLALHLAELGRTDEVLDLFERVRQHLPVAGRTNSLGSWNTLLGMAEALYLVGRDAEVASLEPRIREALALGEWITFDCRLVHTRAALVAAAARDWPEAERRFAVANAIATSVGHRIELAGIRRQRARMLRARAEPGDAELAATLLSEAAALYREMRMERKALQMEMA